MNRSSLILAAIQAALLVLFTLGMARHWWPLGVPNEWEWLRIPDSIATNPGGLVLAFGAVATLAGLAVVGARSLAAGASVGREVAWVAALAVVAIPVQALVQEGAPQGYGLAKWIIALRNEGSSGYQTVARQQMPAGLGAFLRNYPTWIDRQDSLHIGTHPPGLFVVARSLAALTAAYPDLARVVVDHAPGSVEPMIRATRASDPTLTRADAAALVVTGALTLIGSALTVIPLFLLVRATSSAPVAWAAASLWPLVPSAILFQPTADTAFPLLSTSAWAAAAWSVRADRRGTGGLLAVGSGLILAVGMQLTLAYLAVGLVVAVILAAAPGHSGWRARLVGLVLTGLGFGLATLLWWISTGANPATIWWVNQAHHARFYHDYPRNRLSWAVVNPIETAVGLGLAAVVLMIWAGLQPRRVSTATWATLAVLTVLTVSGRSLSEVGRLWVPFFPPLLAAAGVGWERLGANAISLGLTVGLVGVQTLFLQNAIQVVYPI